MSDQKVITWMLIDKCVECGGTDVFKYYDYQKNRYFIQCRNQKFSKPNESKRKGKSKESINMRKNETDKVCGICLSF